MKSILFLSFTALSALAQNDRAFPAIEPVPVAVPAPPSDLAAPFRAGPKPTKSKPPAGANVMAQPVVPPPPVPERGGGGQGGGASITVKRDRVILDNDTFLPRSTKTGRTLVVQTSNPDPTAIANAEEDLSVMALILRKATGGSRGDDKRIALGIEVDSTVFGSSSGARNMFVEGYGALFLLGVRFPLIAPPDKSDESKAKDTPGNDWTEAREEFLNSERSSFEVQLDRAWAGANRAAAEEYDADKVEDLKTALLEALKNAMHIRALKPDDFVTVVIQGAEASRSEKASGRTKATAGSRGSSRRGETVMTLRVKKSDADAFAKGNLDLAGFRKKAVVQTYFRRADASVTTSPFFTP